MSSSSFEEYFRAWMDKPHQIPGTELLTTEYSKGLTQFMTFAENQETTLKSGKMFCPCTECENRRYFDTSLIWRHLYLRGFMASYKIWYKHGENGSMVDLGSTSTTSIDERIEASIGERTPEENVVGTVQMIYDAYPQYMPLVSEEEDMVDYPNAAARKFFDMLDACKRPLYDGCKEGHSALSTATKLMNIKTDHNLSEECVDAIAEFVKDVLPEDNLCPGSYREIEKLVAGLGLPYEIIDVCIDNCMIYWGDDVGLDRCRHCDKPIYTEKSEKTSIPYKWMWYLPIGERLKRLYQAERTAEAMRWHAEHRMEGEILHPSDAKAWKHIQTVYPIFASEPRNVYLGLSTDGFNPFGRNGRQYSLWPVIVTPYNLPPSLCMRREFLYLTILVPGPEHPKKALDVFLQPLIHELKHLWENGVEAYDVSCKKNFQMRAVLMWTISDFPAYSMLSGWSTHGKLSCPYCQEETDAFWLSHGRKMCWFDCHRRFLPIGHPYRRCKRSFRKNRKVLTDRPPVILDGHSTLKRISEFGADPTLKVGGNGHVKDYGYGEHHNWQKVSIFWELPYWKDQLLRHNLDVMHIEKNFFDNIMNTVLNVPGKTKDNMKSRMDLPEWCCRSKLHILDNGRVRDPLFRLKGEKKEEFFDWICDDVKFPDGYASNLKNCVATHDGKFTKMKSHDCHVIMQRLLPFAFTGLLSKNIHESIAGIAAFFRDLCSRSLTTEGIKNLEVNIPVILCNLEKIFPPSFFDVMEHLTIHLPREAELGGPVQYRWMYPFERYMFHLKKKVKNLSKVEGSIANQVCNEERSNFASLYFAPNVRTKSRRPGRCDDGSVIPSYPAYVPNIFTQIGRLSGKLGEKRNLTEQEITHVHMYILNNCEDILHYERLYEGEVRFNYPSYTEDDVQRHKEFEFHKWLPYHVNATTGRGELLPTWLEELARGPLSRAVSYRMYFIRGYGFQIHRPGSTRATSNSGVCTRSGDVVYYGVLREILEVTYPGLLNLKCVVFNCDWYNPIEGTGVKHDQFGVTSVHTKKNLGKYDPFILASQADQVCYIRYPRVTSTEDNWVTVSPIIPRGAIVGDITQEPMQQHTTAFIQSLEINLAYDSDEQAYEELCVDSDGGVGEFQESEKSTSTEYSSDSD